MDIVVFGRGKYFKHKEKWINSHFHVYEILDNRIEMGGCSYQDGYKCINPHDCKKLKEKKIFLMSTSIVSMWKQLVKLGAEPKNIVFPFNDGEEFEYENYLRIRVDSIAFRQDCIEVRMKNGEVEEIDSEDRWKNFVRKVCRESSELLRAVAEMKPEPISRVFGADRGTPIDRKYIERFLDENRTYISGDLLEIEDNTYSLRYGHDIRCSYVMDMIGDYPNSFLANLETGEGIREGVADCFILTQTLMYIFDIDSAVRNIHRTLKKDGVVLVTCSGISQNSRRCMDEWGTYYNFNALALKQLFEKDNRFEVLNYGSFGNVKTVTAHIVGMRCEDLKDEDFIPNDVYYPLITFVAARKI